MNSSFERKMNAVGRFDRQIVGSDPAYQVFGLKEVFGLKGDAMNTVKVIHGVDGKHDQQILSEFRLITNNV